MKNSTQEKINPFQAYLKRNGVNIDFKNLTEEQSKELLNVFGGCPENADISDMTFLDFEEILHAAGLTPEMSLAMLKPIFGVKDNESEQVQERKTEETKFASILSQIYDGKVNENQIPSMLYDKCGMPINTGNVTSKNSTPAELFDECGLPIDYIKDTQNTINTNNDGLDK